MTEDERPTVIVIPTYLGFVDAFYVLAGGAGVHAFCIWAYWYQGVPFSVLVLPMAITSAWMLTMKSVADVRYIGWLAVIARNKLGERDVHEWLLAAAYFWRLTEWPIWHRRLYWFGLWTLSKHRGKCSQCVLLSS